MGISVDSDKRVTTVAKSEKLQNYSHCSKQLGIARVSRKWKLKERKTHRWVA